MKLMERLAAAAGLTIKKVGSLELVASEDASKFLGFLETRNLAILGIEGFRMAGGRPIPDMEAIVDFSGLPYDKEIVATTIEAARRFVVDVSEPGMYFDFTLGDEEGQM